MNSQDTSWRHAPLALTLQQCVQHTKKYLPVFYCCHFRNHIPTNKARAGCRITGKRSRYPPTSGWNAVLVKRTNILEALLAGSETSYIKCVTLNHYFVLYKSNILVFHVENLVMPNCPFFICMHTYKCMSTVTTVHRYHGRRMGLFVFQEALSD